MGNLTICCVNCVYDPVIDSDGDFVSELFAESNAEPFLKDIFPALFAHPSIHLFGMSAFGFLALFLGKMASRVLVLVAIMVVADAGFAFYLGAINPGLLLLTAAGCIGAAAFLARDSGALE